MTDKAPDAVAPAPSPGRLSAWLSFALALPLLLGSYRYLAHALDLPLPTSVIVDPWWSIFIITAAAGPTYLGGAWLIDRLTSGFLPSFVWLDLNLIAYTWFVWLTIIHKDPPRGSEAIGALAMFWAALCSIAAFIATIAVGISVIDTLFQSKKKPASVPAPKADAKRD